MFKSEKCFHFLRTMSHCSAMFAVPTSLKPTSQQIYLVRPLINKKIRVDLSAATERLTRDRPPIVYFVNKSES